MSGLTPGWRTWRPTSTRTSTRVSRRMSVNDLCSEFNPLFERISNAADRLGWHTQIAYRNIDPARYRPESAGYIGFGDQSGAKQSTLVTYLQDAYDAGASIVVGASVDKVLLEDGRAAGVTGVWTIPPAGAEPRRPSRRPGSSPPVGWSRARSGIGGRAVGRNPRLHPTTGALAIFDDDVKAWWGAPHTLLVDHFERDMAYGFRLEGAHYVPGVLCSAVPFESAEQHRSFMEKLATGGCYLARIRDHGCGQVVLDETARRRSPTR